LVYYLITEEMTRRRRRSKKAVGGNGLHPSYQTYIYKVLKQVHPDTGISNKAMQICNDITYDILKRIAEEAKNILQNIKPGATLTSREIQTAARLVFKNELAKHAVSEGTKAVTKFHSSDARGGGSKLSHSARAGLIFPIGRIRTYLKNGMFAKRIGKGAPVYLAAVLEYIIAEILELGGNAARDNKKARITPRHLMLAIRNDEELNGLMPRCIITGGGVLPNIHVVILRKCGADTGFQPGTGFPFGTGFPPSNPFGTQDQPDPQEVSDDDEGESTHKPHRSINKF